jgi:hypothetical protein
MRLDARFASWEKAAAQGAGRDPTSGNLVPQDAEMKRF